LNTLYKRNLDTLVTISNLNTADVRYKLEPGVEVLRRRQATVVVNLLDLSLLIDVDDKHMTHIAL
jgi:hypothetical protein